MLSAVRNGALVVAASGNFGAEQRADLPGRPASRPDGRRDRSHRSRGDVLERFGQRRPRGARRRDQRGRAVPLHRRRLPVPRRDELLGADRVGRRRARLDGAERPRQRPDLRACSAPRRRTSRRAASTPRPASGCSTSRRALVAPAPNRDSTEPNDDVRLVRPRRPLPFRRRRRSRRGRARVRSCAAPSTAIEDPDDVYRVWVPAHRELVVRASNSAVRLRLWRPGTPTVTEEGVAQARDLLASRAGHVKTREHVAGGRVLLRGRPARPERRERALPAERQDRRSREAVAAVHSAHAIPGFRTRTVTDSTSNRDAMSSAAAAASDSISL